ncbi:hypothetical protein BDF20DRAFT_838182 [Mycotypha africana]|uniref:uncharacterized protein n=1 Tax=Mycotypha africana TaxID=64632 RepID=UPI0022FFC484|nr:uncharacterized protein BDF20DRAFT_838182 [Mycotypha africana]KAI8971906.1 hypothetical protein BDF20DRAFT_838182 [Mycotypha africana]
MFGLLLFLWLTAITTIFLLWAHYDNPAMLIAIPLLMLANLISLFILHRSKRKLAIDIKFDNRFSILRSSHFNKSSLQKEAHYLDVAHPETAHLNDSFFKKVSWFVIELIAICSTRNLCSLSLSRTSQIHQDNNTTIPKFYFDIELNWGNFLSVLSSSLLGDFTSIVDYIRTQTDTCFHSSHEEYMKGTAIVKGYSSDPYPSFGLLSKNNDGHRFSKLSSIKIFTSSLDEEFLIHLISKQNNDIDALEEPAFHKEAIRVPKLSLAKRYSEKLLLKIGEQSPSMCTLV